VSIPVTKMWVAVASPVVYLKIAGAANFTASGHFKRVVLELAERGLRCFQVDLSECLNMDSTFLGMLAGLASQLALRRSGDQTPNLVLQGPNQRVVDHLENLGILNLFTLSRQADFPPLTLAPLPAVATPPSPLEMSRDALEAHQTLMHLNPANIPKFKDVVQFLAEDISRQESENT
jgi:anti-sigma B factor antagonist